MERQELTRSGELHTSLTVDIDGSSLPFDKFREAQEKIAILLREVEQKLAEGKRSSVSWVVSSITSGSVHLTLEGIPTDDAQLYNINEVITTVETGLAELEERPERPLFFSDRALESAKALAELVGKDIVGIQVGSNSHKVNLTKHLVANVDELIGARYKSFGSVEGVLKSITIHKRQAFRIYDLLTDRSVACYFPPEFLENIKNAFGKRVSVYGLIRSREDGEKVSIKVEEMEVFPSEEQLPTIEDVIGILGGED